MNFTRTNRANTAERRMPPLTFLLLILVLCTPGRTPAGEKTGYLWPTDASRNLTSSFGEFRPGHFHAGLDIKTWGREGYKVFATRDGYIFRVRISPFGYGKVIYQKLDTGEIAVYAHLQRFAPRLERIMRRLQRKKRRYTVTMTFAPDAYPVKRGDLIAYTGRTGIGYPHLHFEIRETLDEPVNPLLKGFRLKDTRAPVARRIAFLPLELGSQVNGSPLPQVFPLKAVSARRYVLAAPVQIWGLVGVAVEAYDHADGVPNKFSVYRTVLLVDDKEIFRSTYRKFSYHQTNQIYLDRNFRLLERNGAKFYNLFVEPGNTLPFYQPSGPSAGTLYVSGYADSLVRQTSYLSWLKALPSPIESLEERFLARLGGTPCRLSQGTHELRVLLEDFWGNRAFVEAPLVALQKPEPPRQWYPPAALLQKPQFQEEGNWYRLSPRYSWQTVDPASLFPRYGANGEGPAKGFRVRFPLMFLRNLGGAIPGFPEFIVPEPAAASLPRFTLRLSVWDPLATVTLLADGPVLQPVALQMVNRRVGRQKLHLLALDDRHLVAAFPAFDMANDTTTLILTAKADRDTLLKKKVFLHRISGDQGGRCSSADGRMTLVLPGRASNRDLYFTLTQLPLHKLGLSIPCDSISPAYGIGDLEVPLLKSGRLHFRLPSGIRLVRQIGVYQPDLRKKRWQFVGNRLNANRTEILANINGEATLVLLRDDRPPTFRFVVPKKGQTVASPRPEILIRYDDDLSGVADERDFQLTLDGRLCIAEPDPEMKTVRYRPEFPLAPGRHRLRFWIRDRAGNETRRAAAFYVKGKK